MRLSAFRKEFVFWGHPIRFPGFTALVLGAYAFIPDNEARLQFWNDHLGPALAPYLASPWTGIVLIAIGLAWLWHFRGVVTLHHGQLTAQTKVGASIEMQVIPSAVRLDSAKGGMDVAPDWPIRNLFFRLNPNLSQTKNRADFEAVAAEILDRLSTGRLMAWGRAIGRSRTLPLYLVPEDYWLHARLNIWLLDDDGGDILQASPVDTSAPNKTQYREILISQAQALAEWPDRFVPPNKAPEHIPLPAAAKRVLEASLTNLLGTAAMREPTPERRLNYVGIYIAYTKGVRLFGQRPPLDMKEAVPREHMGRYRMEGATELYFHGGNGPTYVALSVLSSDLEAVWQELISDG